MGPTNGPMLAKYGGGRNLQAETVSNSLSPVERRRKCNYQVATAAGLYTAIISAYNVRRPTELT